VKKLDFNELFSVGWEKLMAQIGMAIVWTLVYAVGAAVLGFIIIGIIVLPAWIAGYFEVMKKLFHGETVEFSDFLAHFNKLGNLWVAFILIYLGIAVGTILFVIPGIIVMVLWSMAFFLIIDKDMDAISAMKASWERVKEEFWMVLGLIIVLGIINGIGGMVFGVGVLLTMPFMMLVLWATYYVLFPSAEAAAAAPSYTPPPPPPSEPKPDDEMTLK
jgi:hypothetical protein